MEALGEEQTWGLGKGSGHRTGLGTGTFGAQVLLGSPALRGRATCPFSKEAAIWWGEEQSFCLLPRLEGPPPLALGLMSQSPVRHFTAEKHSPLELSP